VADSCPKIASFINSLVVVCLEPGAFLGAARGFTAFLGPSFFISFVAFGVALLAFAVVDFFGLGFLEEGFLCLGAALGFALLFVERRRDFGADPVDLDVLFGLELSVAGILYGVRQV
jgi:hypothetical protein